MGGGDKELFAEESVANLMYKRKNSGRNCNLFQHKSCTIQIKQGNLKKSRLWSKHVILIKTDNRRESKDQH